MGTARRHKSIAASPIWAVKNGHVRIVRRCSGCWMFEQEHCTVDDVRKLVELGADINHVDQRVGFRPVIYTATTLPGRFRRQTREGRTEIAQLVTPRGADENHAMGDRYATGHGQTTLHFAAKDRNAGLVRLLLAASTNRNVKSNQDYAPLDPAKVPDCAPNEEVISALEGRSH